MAKGGWMEPGEHDRVGEHLFKRCMEWKHEIGELWKEVRRIPKNGMGHTGRRGGEVLKKVKEERTVGGQNG